ncbi:hypothetical protein [Undibacterium rugosum]|uniref:Cofactor-independent phosphoglycerate mutase n=1 Tax=Undibacterium rugosum TaxID=2762291 RepID=A0A923I5E7_9BURK|nr:hypothetical protein [Undibacterium rugosum]MBC3935876.1 hypothetical protein [Undibacterium rugosum]MBR7779342.1 hypothetical protein [Undibacterium rugosum]
MKNLALIIPFSIPPSGLEKDLLRNLNTPATANLLGWAERQRHPDTDAFARALPHEYWLTGHFPPESTLQSPSYITSRHLQAHPALRAGYWFSLQPVHIHIARDHLVLTDHRQLELTDEQAAPLFEIAANTAGEYGLELQAHHSSHWFLRADQWHDLKTATPDAACGHNIDVWMPQGESARAWRKFQNEVQMQWFDHEVNQRREQSGLKPVNSMWLYGGTQPQNLTPATAVDIETPRWLSTHCQPTPSGLWYYDALISAALNSDWSSWLDQFHTMEQHLMLPALDALNSGQIDKLRLICTDTRRCIEFHIRRNSKWKFWKKPGLTPLFEGLAS